LARRRGSTQPRASPGKALPSLRQSEQNFAVKSRKKKPSKLTVRKRSYQNRLDQE
jgi:hypothetical protein